MRSRIKRLSLCTPDYFGYSTLPSFQPYCLACYSIVFFCRKIRQSKQGREFWVDFFPGLAYQLTGNYYTVGSLEMNFNERRNEFHCLASRKAENNSAQQMPYFHRASRHPEKTLTLTTITDCQYGIYVPETTNGVNLSGRKLDSVEDMGQWLDVDKLDGEGEASDPPDIFVVGFQEVFATHMLVCPIFQPCRSVVRRAQPSLHVCCRFEKRPVGKNERFQKAVCLYLVSDSHGSPR